MVAGGVALLEIEHRLWAARHADNPRSDSTSRRSRTGISLRPGQNTAKCGCQGQLVSIHGLGEDGSPREMPHVPILSLRIPVFGACESWRRFHLPLQVVQGRRSRLVWLQDQVGEKVEEKSSYVTSCLAMSPVSSL